MLHIQRIPHKEILSISVAIRAVQCNSMYGLKYNLRIEHPALLMLLRRAAHLYCHRNKEHLLPFGLSTFFHQYPAFFTYQYHRKEKNRAAV